MSSANYAKRVIDNLTEEERLELYFDLEDNLSDQIQAKARELDLVHVADDEEEAIEAYKKFGQIDGLRSGFYYLDKLTKGFRPSQLIIVSGKTSAGKTALAVNVSYQMALKGHKILFITLEMTQREIRTRLYHLHQKSLVDLPILLQKEQFLDWRDVKVLMDKAKAEGVEMVVIDHLHYFDIENDKNESSELGRITREMKKNANLTGIPVMLLAQLRKKVGGGKSTTNDDLYGSVKIAQGADTVLFVQRPDKDHIQVIATKVREGGVDPDGEGVVFKFDRTRIIE